MAGDLETDAGRRVREPSLADAVVPLVALAVLIGGSLALFGLDGLDGPIQVAGELVILAVSVAGALVVIVALIAGWISI